MNKDSLNKEHKCCKCNKIINYKPYRLVFQLNDNKETYSAYHNIHNYDLCNRCFKIFKIWIEKGLNNDSSKK